MKMKGILMLQRRRFFIPCLLVGAFLLASVFSLVSAPSAQAATGDLACTANFQIDFNPALTATQTTAQTSDTAGFADCTSLNGHTDLKSATVQATGPATSKSGVPCNLLLTVTGTGTVEWNTGQISGFSFTVNTNPTKGTITLSANITSGPLSRDTITAVPVIAHPNIDCAIKGLTSLTSELTALTFA
jgi:hypothetical protein